MAQTPPTSITAAPSPAPQRNDRTTFSTRVDAFVTWLIAAVTQFNATATNVYNNAVDAYNSAISAAASSASALAATNITEWISGTTYAIGNNVWSPINFLTYRRKTAGAGTTDPSADSTNWEVIGGARVGANSDITSLSGLTTALSVAQGGTGSTSNAGTAYALKGANSDITSLIGIAGLIDISNSSAGQIKFPATQNASANANTLDDYEEGTWTPAAFGVTLAASAGSYTKTGDRCNIDLIVTWPSNANGSAANLSNLPFTVGAAAGISIGYTSTTVTLLGSIATSTSQINLYILGGAGVTNADMSGHNFWASGTFKV